MNNAEIIELTHQHMVDVYGCLPLAFARGHGAYLYDADGNRYLDFFCGLAVTSLGHGNPRVVRAIKEQAEKLTHVSNVFHTEPTAPTGRAARESLRRRKSFPRQLRRRGQRSRDQARAAMGQQRWRRALRDFDDARLVPRTHARDCERDRPGAVPSGVSTADARLQNGAVRRSRGARSRAARRNRRRDGRTDPGRGRRGRAARRLPEANARLVRSPQAAVDPRRSADRNGAHRKVFRVRAHRHQARYRDAGEGARRRTSDRRDDRARRDRGELYARQSRQHLRRKSGGVRGRGRRDRRARTGRRAGERHRASAPTCSSG